MITKFYGTKISLTQVMENGCHFVGKDGKITVFKNNNKLIFDMKIKTKNGYVLAAVIKPANHKRKQDLSAIAEEKEKSKTEKDFLSLSMTKTPKKLPSQIKRK